MGIEEGTSKVRIQVDPKYYRPTEVVSVIDLTFVWGFLYIIHTSLVLFY